MQMSMPATCRHATAHMKCVDTHEHVACCVYTYIHVCTHMSTCVMFVYEYYLSVCLSVYLPIYLRIHPPAHLFSESCLQSWGPQLFSKSRTALSFPTCWKEHRQIPNTLDPNKNSFEKGPTVVPLFLFTGPQKGQPCFRKKSTSASRSTSLHVYLFTFIGQPWSRTPVRIPF